MILNDRPLRRPPLLLLGLLAWVLAEIAAFGVVVDQLGWPGAILLQILISIIGFRLLRDLGARAGETLRLVIEQGSPRDGTMLHGLLAALGAVLMIVPGFVSDLIGMALSAPSLRHVLARRFGGGATRPATPDMIDLAPHEWSRLEPGAKPRRSEPSGES